MAYSESDLMQACEELSEELSLTRFAHDMNERIHEPELISALFAFVEQWNMADTDRKLRVFSVS